MGVVFSQSVTGTASKGSEVVLTVSSGSTKVAIPSVVGQSEATATAQLQEAGFDVVTTSVSSEVISAGYVVEQSQSGQAARGTTIEIKVSTGPEQKEEKTDTNNSSNGSGNTSGDTTTTNTTTETEGTASTS